MQRTLNLAISVAFFVACSSTQLSVGSDPEVDGGDLEVEPSNGSVGTEQPPSSPSGSPPSSGVARNISAVFAGSFNTCALVNSELYCWGANSRGELGNGSTTDSPVPVPVQGLPKGATAATFGNRHGCALVSGGVFCWGANDFGQLGDGTEIDRLTAVQVRGLESGVTAISAGDFHTCAIVNGGLQCWGWAQYGRHLGNLPVQIPDLSSGVTAVSAGPWFTCNLVENQAYCWGGNGSLETLSPLPVRGLAADIDALAVNGGVLTSCALSSGGVECWRNNGTNIYNDGSNTWGSDLVSVQGLGAGVTAVTVGGPQDCALVDGGVQCWDYIAKTSPAGFSGYAVTGTTDPVPIQGLASGVSAIAAGSRHTCALVKGEIQCWGNNSRGSLGNNSKTDSSIPVQVRFP